MLAVPARICYACSTMPGETEPSMNVAVKLPPARHPPMSVAEFLAWPGDGSDTRYELVHGELRAQDAASDAHGSIQARLIALLSHHLDATRPGCRVVAAPGIRPHLLANWNYRIPELGVTCTQNRADEHAMPNPILLIEVLSPSNRQETWSNIPLYASVPSVMEILLVDSTRVEAQLLRRNADGIWPTDPTPIAASGTITLTSIGFEQPLAGIYRDTYLA